MSEIPRMSTIGFGLVDHKVFDKIGPLPVDELGPSDEFLSEVEHFDHAGGSIANTANAFALRLGRNVRLYHTIATDSRGELIRRQTSPLVSTPRIVEEGHSGFCILDIGENGEIDDEITVYGVSTDIEIPKDDLLLDKNDLVISNVNSLRYENVWELSSDLLKTLDRKKGFYALRLSGAHSVLATQDDANRVLENLPKQPDVIFGNMAEISNTLGETDSSEAIEHFFADTRVLIITDGPNNIKLRVDGKVIDVPTPKASRVIDVTGAGDHLMGVSLAEMTQKPFREWSIGFLKSCIEAGSMASSAVITTKNSRLSMSEIANAGVN